VPWCPRLVFVYTFALVSPRPNSRTRNNMRICATWQVDFPAYCAPSEAVSKNFLRFVLSLEDAFCVGPLGNIYRNAMEHRKQDHIASSQTLCVQVLLCRWFDQDHLSLSLSLGMITRAWPSVPSSFDTTSLVASDDDGYYFGPGLIAIWFDMLLCYTTLILIATGRNPSNPFALHQQQLHVS
jgi:hypothetical protein